jgi:hypothetical protein
VVKLHMRAFNHACVPPQAVRGFFLFGRDVIKKILHIADLSEMFLMLGLKTDRYDSEASGKEREMIANSKNLIKTVVIFVSIWQTVCVGQITASSPYCSPIALESGTTNQVVLAFTATNNTNETIENVHGDIVLSKDTSIDYYDETLWGPNTYIYDTLGPYESFRYGWPAYGGTWPVDIPDNIIGQYYIIFRVYPGGDTCYTPVEIIPPTSTIPAVVTLPVTNVGQTYATLHGRIVDDGGEPCEYMFMYRDLDSSIWQVTDWSGSVRTGDSFNTTVSNLIPATAYEFRADAQNPVGMAYTDDTDFLEFITIGGVKAEYFVGKIPQGLPCLINIEPRIDHKWGDDEVACGLRDDVSARWSAELHVMVSDIYTFITTSDDGVRLYLNGERIINNWTDHASTIDYSLPQELIEGQIYSLVMEWYENTGSAVAQLSWATSRMNEQIIPSNQLQPANRQIATGTGIPIDDFEHFTDDVSAGMAIFQTWIGGNDFPGYPGNDTGARVGHPKPPYSEETVVYSGEQSMPVYYDNSQPPFYYSQVDRIWEEPQDWTVENAEALSVALYGNHSNDPTSLYVLVEDIYGNTSILPHPDPDILTREEWNLWVIPLSKFAESDVKLEEIKKMSIIIGDPSPNGQKPPSKGSFFVDLFTIGGQGVGRFVAKVFNEVDKSPISGATVTVTPSGAIQSIPVPETSNEGEYKVGLLQGEYNVLVIAEGFENYKRPSDLDPTTLSHLSASTEVVFELNPKNQIVIDYPIKLIPYDSDYDDGDWLGRRVSISGNYAIAGALNDNDDTGSAYIFERGPAGWVQQPKLTAKSPIAGEQFGGDVSVSGEYAVIGANSAAYIFQHTTTGWNQQDKLVSSDGNFGDCFGCAVSINGDCAIIGAYGDNDNGFGSGSAYIFRQDSTGWNYEKKLKASDGEGGDWFGNAVSISGDYAIVGAVLDDNSNGNNSGSAYVFWFNGSNWVPLDKLVADNGNARDQFGGSVCITDNYAIIGAIGDDEGGVVDAGAAYIFEKSGDHWVNPYKLHPDDLSDGDHFGNSVSIDGEYAVVAAVLDDDNGEDSGSVYIFKLEGAIWQQKAKLIASDGNAMDFFGQGVSIDDNYVVVGAPYNNENGRDSGSAYIFKRTDTTWSQ